MQSLGMPQRELIKKMEFRALEFESKVKDEIEKMTENLRQDGKILSLTERNNLLENRLERVFFKGNLSKKQRERRQWRNDRNFCAI